MPGPDTDLLTTARLLLKRPTVADSPRVLAYRTLNRDHLRQWEPERAEQFYSIQAVEQQLRKMEQQVEEKVALYWLMQIPDRTDVIGECSFTNIVRGPFLACHLGFSLSSKYQDRGFMHEALSAAIAHIFSSHGLHRIMANFQPSNHRSEKLLYKLGFEYEGLAKKFLKINGQWQDHILTSLIETESR